MNDAVKTWRAAVPSPAAAAPAFERALEPFALAISIYEVESRTDKPRNLPEPETWAGDLWIADECIVEAILDGPPDRQAMADAVAVAAAALGMPAPDVVVEPVPDVDWQAEVLASLPAIEVGRFRVRGRHIDTPARPGVTDLEIEAGAAFGSGEHETTRACLASLGHALKRSRPQRTLDLGCGTGVLGFAAAKAAKTRLLLTDIDPRAVGVAEAAARRNGVVARAIAADGWQDPRVQAAGPFDLVMANVLARPLRAMAGDLAAGLKPGGRAILSGFLFWQEAFVMAPHRARGLRLERRVRAGDWLALTLRKPPAL